MVVAQLILTLVATLLAIQSGIWKDKKPTKGFWIAVVAFAALSVGLIAYVQKSNENSELRKMASAEIRNEITAITESSELKALFAQRGASQDYTLIAALHKRIQIGKEDLNAAANRHIGHLEIQEREKLIKFISALSVIDEFLQDGYSDLTGSGARLKLRQARDDGLFDLCK